MEFSEDTNRRENNSDNYLHQGNVQVQNSSDRFKKARGCLITGLAAIGAFTLVGFLVSVIFFFSLISAIKSPAGFTAAGRGDQIAVIHITGEIGSSSGVDAEETVRLLKQAEEDEAVKAVVLRIDSPGGAAAASQEIADYVSRMKKPVVTSVGNSAASGAYWIASACDRIVCNPASSIGSIGVIISVPNLSGLFEKVGIKYVVVYKGKYKDLGNPARELREDEKALLEKHAEKIYRQFIRSVANNRKIEEEKVEELATGEVFTGEDAIALKLADRLGTFEDAIDEAKKIAKIKGKPEVIDYDHMLPYFEQLLRFFSSGKVNLVIGNNYQEVVAK